MKLLSLSVLIFSFATQSLLFSEPVQRKVCQCKDCRCTFQSHCGCFSDKGCFCGGDKGSCCANHDCIRR